MAEIIKSIDVDVAKQNIFKAIVAKQGDNRSRYLKVQLMNEGEALQVESGATVVINAERADGESKAFAGSVNNDGTVTVPIAAWILEIEGQAKCSITILVNEQRLTSTTFYITVERAEFYDGTIEEDDEIDLLLQLLTAAENETERQANEAARIEAEILREQKIRNHNMKNAPVGGALPPLPSGNPRLGVKGENSLIQKVNENDDNPSQYASLENVCEGKGCITAGEANKDTGDRNIETGRLNRSNAFNSIIAGLLNGYGASSQEEPTFQPLSGNNIIVAGQSNSNTGNNVIQGGNNNSNTGNNTIQAGSNNSNTGNNVVQGGYQNENAGNNNAQFGSNNKIIKTVSSSVEPRYNGQVGRGLKITDKQSNFAVGKYNLDKPDTLLEVGNGTADEDRSNAFEVTEDGVARAYGTATNSKDLTNMSDVEKMTSSSVTEEFINSLY